jgi:hypothetical protein
MAKAAKNAKSDGDAPRRDGLSLHPLDLETALGAALQTGRAPDQKREKKPVDKSRQAPRALVVSALTADEADQPCRFDSLPIQGLEKEIPIVASRRLYRSRKRSAGQSG